MMRVGILALQGAYQKHCTALASLGVEPVLVRFKADLSSCDALIIPGGESTTINRLIKFRKLYRPLFDFGRERAIFGTCAGLILLSKSVEGNSIATLNLIDITAVRNAYGRQIESFIEEISVDFIENRKKFTAIFIRAPKIKNIGENVTSLAKMGDEIVLARNRNILVSSFHPELTGDTSIHRYFIEAIVKKI